MEVVNLTHRTGSLAVNSPLLVLLSVELLFLVPFGSSGPGFTTSPVADPVLITGVDESVQVGVIEHPGNLGHQVIHPVSKEEGVDHCVTFNPVSTGDTENFLDISSVEECIRRGEVVAKGREIAGLTDIVHVESGVDGITESWDLRDQRAKLEGSNLHLDTLLGSLTGLQDETLAHFEGSFHTNEHFIRNKTVLMGESSISRVLSERICETITDSETF